MPLGSRLSGCGVAASCVQGLSVCVPACLRSLFVSVCATKHNYLDRKWRNQNTAVLIQDQIANFVHIKKSSTAHADAPKYGNPYRSNPTPKIQKIRSPEYKSCVNPSTPMTFGNPCNFCTVNPSPTDRTPRSPKKQQTYNGMNAYEHARNPQKLSMPPLCLLRV